MKTYANRWGLTGAITKVTESEDGTTVEVEGRASAPERDSDGELITSECMRAAIGPFLASYPALRMMHAPIAAGKVLDAEVQGDGSTWIRAVVVAEESVRLVKAGVLRAFSIGGVVKRRNARDPSIIEELTLREISIVDVPAVRSARIESVKGEAPKQADAPHEGLPAYYGPAPTRFAVPIPPPTPAPEPVPSDGVPASATPQPDRTRPAEPDRPPLEAHHRAVCPDHGGRLVCLSCLREAGAAEPTRKAESGRLAKLAVALTTKVEKVQAERDGALRKLADVERSRDQIAKRLDVATKRAADLQVEVDAGNAELRKRPKGAVRDMGSFIAVSKVEDARGAPEQPEADDLHSLIKLAQRRPIRT